MSSDISIAFEVFGYSIKWYSVCIAIGTIFAYLVINAEAKRLNINTNFIFNMMFWSIIFGIIGARLYYVLFNLSYYKEHLSEIYKIWNGGLAIHGGLITGFIVVVSFCKRYKVNLLKILDIIVPGLIIAQAIGRWGNFFNKEAYGSVVLYQTLINLKIIPTFVIDNMLINGSYHLPMFYFESLWCFIGFIIMLIIRRGKYIKYGSIVSMYLMWYGVGRFVIETFRTDSLMLGSVKVAYIISALMFIIGFLIILVVNGKPKLEGIYNSEIDEINY